ncbi:MAG: threonylcarbamoyl-AMP synthase [Clostridia bacterium]|nr:threonylcarbamoyl-AMP synthase [Clostridia bacterium]
MKTKFYEKCDETELLEAAQILKDGGLVAIPTETVYGLAANAYNGDAVSRVFEAKGRPTDNPMIVHISSIEEIYPLVTDFPEKAKALADAFWPGPLTMILPKSDLVPRQVAPKLETVAVRMPSHPVAKRIIELAGVPLAAPSANSSGSPSPTTAQHVLHDLDGKINAVVDGGECDVGIESTVITLATDPPRLLRPGGITVEQLESVLGHIDVDPAVISELAEGVAPASPGMKYKHYSPRAEVYIVEGSLESFRFLIDSEAAEGDMALCFNGEEASVGIPSLPFGDVDDLEAQAHLLFAELRRFDDLGAKRVFVRAPSSEGVGLGVYNRLLRAAAFKILTPPVIYGLTGQTGAGKSTVAKELERKGYLIVDGDVAAREVVRKGSPVLTELAEVFGSDILDADGELIRAALAKKAFANETERQKLNAITHPAVTRWSIDFIRKNLTDSHKGVVIDAAAIFDSDIRFYCTEMIVVTAPESERLERILKRDGITHEAAMLRIKAQKDEQYYKERADILVRNYAPYNLADELDSL